MWLKGVTPIEVSLHLKDREDREVSVVSAGTVGLSENEVISTYREGSCVIKTLCVLE